MGKKMEGYCSTGQSPQRAVVPVEEEEVCKYLKPLDPFAGAADWNE
jgi:hypothetical protein